MRLFKSSLTFVLLICAGCAAQSASPRDAGNALPPDLEHRIDRQVRAKFEIPPGVKIQLGDRRPSSFPEYDALTVTFSQGERKQVSEFLLSKDGKILLRMTKVDLSQDPYAVVMSKIDVQGRPVRGSSNAKVVIVNYDDFQCPFCARMHQTLFPAILRDYGDRVKIVYKDYPLQDIHPWATHAAVDASCLAVQNGDAYWDFADYVHGNARSISGERRPLGEQFAALDQAALDQGQKHGVNATTLRACIQKQDDSTVRASIKEASALGVEATPTMFINGEKIDGAVPPEELRAALDRALQDAGVQPPANAAAKAPPGKPAN